jgi:AcrR family transcriptional regulator
MKAIDNVKEILLSTAKEVIRDQGLADFNIRTIAKKAGVSIGTVYNYYPSKSELVFETMEMLLRECVSVIETEKNEDLFMEFRNIYFSILHYFDLFQGDIMDDLASLASSKNTPRSTVQMQHMSIFKDTFLKIIQRHRTEINPIIFDRFGMTKVIELILVIFTSYLRKGNQKYELIDFTLRRLLSK